MISVSGFVYDENGRFLLLRHRHWVPDGWGLPGGIVEKAETLEDAFSREVFEETGLKISHIELIEIVSGFHMRMEVYFRSKLKGDKSKHIFKLQDQEILEARFFDFQTLPQNLLSMHRDLIETEQNARSGSALSRGPAKKGA